MLADVEAFRKRFGLGCPVAPRLLSAEEFELRCKLLLEEVTEFVDAHRFGDLPESADALVDLVFVALGTAIEMGLPWHELWSDVVRANMEKRRADHPSESKRGSTADLVKPPDWQPPHSAAIITRALRRAVAEEDALRLQQQMQLPTGFEEEQHDQAGPL